MGSTQCLPELTKRPSWWDQYASWVPIQKRWQRKKGYLLMPNNGQQFRVEIDGIDLPDEVLQRVDNAVRKAVLAELATVNLGGQTVDLLSEGLTVDRIREGGHLQGFRVRQAQL